jgi:hypothetical protein
LNERSIGSNKSDAIYPGKNKVSLLFVVEEYKEILREILDEDDGRMQ